MTDDPALPLHAHSHSRPGRPLRLSFLRYSAAQRLVGASTAIALLWAAVFWALP